MKFASPGLQLKALELINRVRFRIEKEFYGDQAVFCTREAVKQVGGYPSETIMESAHFCNALKHAGKLRLVTKPVITSPRRFHENGFWRTFWFDFKAWVRFRVGLHANGAGKEYWTFNQKDQEHAI